MMGDFNEILNNEEKIGGPKRSALSFVDFAGMLDVCELKELVGHGDSFTWAGVRYKKNIQCKLDRCFGNRQWRRFFPDASQVFMEMLGSDHRHVMVNFFNAKDRKRALFRFDKRLVGRNRVFETIRDTWSRARQQSNVYVFDKLGEVQRSLGKWKRENEVNSNEKLMKLRHELDLESGSLAPCWDRVRALKIEIGKAFHEEEEFWRQKSRDKWLVVGDNNTCFFHASVKATRQRNFISKLVEEDGQEFTSNEDMGKVAAGYFEKLFSTSVPVGVESFFAGMEPRVTEAMNFKLIREVTGEEIREAVFSIKPLSVPGADGMNGLFFQQYWEVIGPDVTREIKGFFSSGGFPQEWNLTQLCLISKVNNPTTMVDLRPISLCSVMYKIVSKVLVTRLKPLLEHVVSPTQSAFVPERLISDNIIIAHELVHGLRTHERISKDFMAIKTDMSKAYDRIEWTYLETLLKVLGFHEILRNWIMFCVRTVSYTVLMNGEAEGKINPSRGLRQGDPLSPFLFDLCTEGLSHQLNETERRGEVSGIQFAETGPSVTHLFTDDSPITKGG